MVQFVPVDPEKPDPVHTYIHTPVVHWLVGGGCTAALHALHEHEHEPQ